MTADKNHSKDISAPSADKISRSEFAANAFQSLLIGIPHIGASLERFIYGTAQELRMKRMERTLGEVAESLKAKDAIGGVEKEEFVDLLEKVAPSIARTTVEERRLWFRDLLVNAAMTPPGDPQWEETRLAAELIGEVDAPGLEILAALNLSEYSGGDAAIALDGRPMIYRWPKDVLNGTSACPLIDACAATEPFLWLAP